MLDVIAEECRILMHFREIQWNFCYVIWVLHSPLKPGTHPSKFNVILTENWYYVTFLVKISFRHHTCRNSRPILKQWTFMFSDRCISHFSSPSTRSYSTTRAIWFRKMTTRWYCYRKIRRALMSRPFREKVARWWFYTALDRMRLSSDTKCTVSNSHKINDFCIFDVFFIFINQIVIKFTEIVDFLPFILNKCFGLYAKVLVPFVVVITS